LRSGPLFSNQGISYIAEPVDSAPVAGFSAPFFEPPWQHFIALPLLQQFFPHLSWLHIFAQLPPAHIFAQSPVLHIFVQSPLQHFSPQVLPEP
jgi:hypothetical protein